MQVWSVHVSRAVAERFTGFFIAEHDLEQFGQAQLGFLGRDLGTEHGQVVLGEVFEDREVHQAGTHDAVVLDLRATTQGQADDTTIRIWLDILEERQQGLVVGFVEVSDLLQVLLGFRRVVLVFRR